MEIKKQILRRIAVIYILLIILGVGIIYKVITIQFIEKKYWMSLNEQSHYKKEEIEAERGTIYASNKEILSASFPFYDVYVDFGTANLRKNRGRIFFKNVDSLSFALSKILGDKSIDEYKKMLKKIYKEKERFYELKKNITYFQMKQLKKQKLIKEGMYKSGFIFVVKNKRIYPYGDNLFANRTIGYARNNIIQNVGLERKYNEYLRGGKEIVTTRSIAGGNYIIEEGRDFGPQRGKDILTTINVQIQDIAENALLNMLQKQNASAGTCIVMEVSTGKILALANLGFSEEDNAYFEDFNYALQNSEPGSTFKLFSLMALLEQYNVSIEDTINLMKGVYKYGKNYKTGKDIMMYDSEKHNITKASIKHAFAVSSNVGISRLIDKYYKHNPQQFLSYFKEINFEDLTELDLVGEMNSVLPNPKDKAWSVTTSLPWMSIGYEVSVAPIKTLMYYNAVANDGYLVKPYLVEQVQDLDKIVYQHSTQSAKQICSNRTVKKLRLLLSAVVEEGTVKNLFKNAYYKVAGKTGTNLMHQAGRGYGDTTGKKSYQASFVGFFPLEKPKYSCIVVVKNKPGALVYYGANVAAPIFKTITDKLSILDQINDEHLDIKEDILQASVKPQSSRFTTKENNMMYEYIESNKDKNMTSNIILPDFSKMSFSNALYEAHKLGIVLEYNKNYGRILKQNIPAGTIVKKQTKIILTIG